MTSFQDNSDHPDAAKLNHEAYRNGCSYYERKDYKQAKVLFEQALEYRPEDARTWFALGNCHDLMNQPTRAEVCYLMSLQHSAEDAQPNVYFNLGNSLFDQGKYQEAIDCYTKIGDNSKAYAPAQRNLSLAQARLPQIQ